MVGAGAVDDEEVAGAAVVLGAVVGRGRTVVGVGSSGRAVVVVVARAVVEVTIDVDVDVDVDMDMDVDGVEEDEARSAAVVAGGSSGRGESSAGGFLASRRPVDRPSESAPGADGRTTAAEARRSR